MVRSSRTFRDRKVCPECDRLNVHKHRSGEWYCDNCGWVGRSPLIKSIAHYSNGTAVIRPKTVV